MKMPNVGAHIKVNRPGYTHHGIYFGANKVVHYSGFAEPGKKGKIRYTSFSDFLGGEKHYDVVEYPISSVRYSPTEVIVRALGRVSEDKYNLAFNNCEHFACWCITGESKSKQVRGFLLLGPLGISITNKAPNIKAPNIDDVIIPSILRRFFD